MVLSTLTVMSAALSTAGGKARISLAAWMANANNSNRTGQSAASSSRRNRTFSLVPLRMMVKFVTKWVVSFSQSRIVRELENGQYLTVSIPEISSSEIKGIKIVNRAPSFADYRFKKIWEKQEENGDETKEVWLAEEFRKPGDIPEDTDVYWYLKGYIVIVPMSLGENDQLLLKKIQERKTDIPEWPIK